MGRTRVVVRVKAPRARVYQALTDPKQVAQWQVPDDMTCEIHEYDAKVGGAYRMTLTYKEETSLGKTTENSDSFHGTFTELVPDEKVAYTVEFETPSPEMQGESNVTITLGDAPNGTELVALHENLPGALSPFDNETGWRASLNKLAALCRSPAA